MDGDEKNLSDWDDDSEPEIIMQRGRGLSTTGYESTKRRAHHINPSSSCYKSPLAYEFKD